MRLWQQAKIGWSSPRSDAAIRALSVFLVQPPFYFEINVFKVRFPRTSRTGTVALGREDRPEERVRRETGAMSTSLVQPHSATSWKQEVNLRLAAHRSRRGMSTAQPPAPAPSSWPKAGSRGAQAAARVAARYAHAPSYSQLQAAVDDAADQLLPAAKGSTFGPFISPAKSTRALSSEGCFSEFSQAIFPIPAAIADHAPPSTLAVLPAATAAPRPWEPEARPLVPPSVPEREAGRQAATACAARAAGFAGGLGERILTHPPGTGSAHAPH